MEIVRRMDEQSLVKACLRKERRAQELLYKRYYGRMMGVCLRYARDRDEASSMLNHGFFKVFETLERFDPEKGRLDGWIYRIVMHAAIDHYRAVLRQASVAGEPDDLLTSRQDEAESALDRLSAQEILGLVQQLSPAYRTVFNLYAIEGMSHHEIAELLGISEGTSKSNLAKARRNLQQLLLAREVPKKVRYVP
jgi:RNA polymerase sigma factor (sigma-70 family)